MGFAPLDATGTQLSRRYVATVYERVSLGVASHSPFEPRFNGVASSRSLGSLSSGLVSLGRPPFLDFKRLRSALLFTCQH